MQEVVSEGMKKPATMVVHETGKKNSQYKLMPGIWSTHLIDIAPVVQNGAAEVGYTGEGTCRKHTAFHLAGVVMTTVLVPSVPNGLPISGGDPEDQGPG